MGKVFVATLVFADVLLTTAATGATLLGIAVVGQAHSLIKPEAKAFWLGAIDGVSYCARRRIDSDNEVLKSLS